MRQLYEKYWSLASEEDLEDKAKKEYSLKMRMIHRRMSKHESQIELLDRVIKVIDTTVKNRNDSEKNKDPVLERVRALIKEE